MAETDRWLRDYGESHRNITHAPVYWLSMLALILGTVGLLWAVPVPDEFIEISPVLNWGTAFLLATVVYYFIISLPLAIGLLPFVLGIAFIQQWLQTSGFSPMRVAIGFTIAGIIGLWLGHRNRSSLDALRHLVEDLQTIMIGPAWLLSVLYRRLRIPY